MYNKFTNYVLSRILALVCIVFMLGITLLPALAQVMESGSYRIQSDSINIGGGDSSSLNYGFESTVGEVGSGRSSSATYILEAGYQQSQATSVTTPTEESGIGNSIGGIGLQITSFEIIEGTTSGVLRFTTSVPAQTTLFWGRGMSYELGSHTEETYMREHTMTLTGLLPETRYFFKIDGKPQIGFSRTIRADSFTTLVYPDVSGPGNVQSLQAIREGEDIILTWKNPYDADFAYVQVFGSDVWYPDSEGEELIYEGGEERAIDRARAIPNTTRYYTVYSYDANGNRSSGAIVALTIDSEGNVSLVDFDTQSFTEVPLEIDLDDLMFIQNNQVVSSENGVVTLDGSRALLVVLPYEKVPEHLKSIIMTITNSDGSGSSFSFLLRVNEEKTAYTAAVAPLGITGSFPFSILLVDYTVKQMGKVEGIFATRLESPTDVSVPLLMRMGYFPYFILVLIVLLLLAYRLIRGRWW